MNNYRIQFFTHFKLSRYRNSQLQMRKNVTFQQNNFKTALD